MAAQVQNPYAAAAPAAAPYRASAVGLAGRGLVALVMFWVVVTLAFWGNFDHYATATVAAIYVLVALSLNILIGYTGQLSLGHQGFLGLGALTAAYLVHVSELPFPIAIVGAIGVTAGTSFLLGLVALRITGLYFALITLVFGLTLQASLFEVESLTGGGAGQPADRPGFLLENHRFYWFCLVMVLIVLYVDRQLMASKSGRALLALKENERVAEAFGINTSAFKLVAFTLAGAIVGLAGALFAFKSQSFAPADYNFQLGLIFVVMTVVGGTGSRLGAVFGGTLFAVLEEWILHPFFTWAPVEDFLSKWWGLRQFTGDHVVYVPLFVSALLLLVTLVQYPGGIAQQLKPVTAWLAGKPFSMHPDRESGPGAVEGSSVRA